MIDKVVEYLLRTPEFEIKVREKEQGNPKFSFLFGGENSDYYQWRVYCAKNPGAGMTARYPSFHPLFFL